MESFDSAVSVREDDPATKVYGRLLHRHLRAAQADFQGEERKRLFDLVEAFRAEFPAECNAFEERYGAKP